MLMKFPTPATARERLVPRLDAAFGWLRLGAGQLSRAMRHRRDVTVLVDQDDHLLADIGLTREDVRHAIAQPFWRDPTETLAQSASARWRRPSRRPDVTLTDDSKRRAVAELNGSELMHLSDLGRRIRRETGSS